MEAQPTSPTFTTDWTETNGTDWTDWTIWTDRTNWTDRSNWTAPTTTERPLPMSTASYVIAGLSLSLLSLVAFVVNLMLLRSFFLVRRLRPYLILNRSLVAADSFSLFFFGLGMLLFTVLEPLGMGLEPCVKLTIETLRMCGIMVTLFHLGALTAYHYSGILMPLDSVHRHTRRRLNCCTILLWVVPVLLLCSYIFMLQSGGPYMCSFDFLKYQKFRTTFCAPFFIILPMMVIVYVHIYRSVNSRRVGGTELRVPAKKRRTLITSMIILGSTIVGWVPAFGFYALVCKDCLLRAFYQRRTVDEFAHVYVNNLLLILKTATNCLIYAMRIKEIEKPFVDMVLKWCGRSRGSNSTSRDQSLSLRAQSRSSTRMSRASSCRMSTLVRRRSEKDGVQLVALDGEGGTYRFSRHRPNTTSV